MEPKDKTGWLMSDRYPSFSLTDMKAFDLIATSHLIYYANWLYLNVSQILSVEKVPGVLLGL